MAEESAQEIFATTLPEKLEENPDAAKSTDAIYVFNVTGDDGGTWTLNFKKDDDFVSEGDSDDAECTVTMSDSDFVDMWNGDLNPAQAFMMNKISIEGNMGLAMKLQNFIG